MSDFDVDLVEGLAEVLATAGAGTWRSSGVYAANEVAIVVGVVPQQPPAVISLMPYGVTDDPSLSDSVIGVQVTTRAAGQDPRATLRLTGDVFDALHGLADTDLPTGVHVNLLLRQSWTSLGQDSNNRWRAAQNFYATCHRPTTHRI